MDIIRDKILDTLRTVACERFGINLESENAKVYVNYDKEVVCFQDRDKGLNIEVNCAADSESAAVIDFCKAIL